MNFLSLPEPIKIRIFKKLDWSSLKNIKLVCRSLYFTIEENLRSLDKPNLDQLDISCQKNSNDNQVINVNYVMYNRRNRYTIYENKLIKFDNLDEFEQFLRYFNFTPLKSLVIDINGNTDVLRIFNNHYTGSRYIKCLSIVDISRSEGGNINDMLSLLKKVEDATDVYITLNFPNIKMPINFPFSHMKSLSFFIISEVNGTKLITTKMIIDLIINNRELESIDIHSDDGNKNLYMEISKQIFELDMFRFENRCDSRELRVSFNDVRNFTLSYSEFYRKLSNNVNSGDKFVINHRNGSLSFENMYKCPKCRIGHSNRVHYDNILSCLSITLN